MICKVLIVDDASFVRMMIRQVLIRLGHTNILEAENGFEAIKLYKANTPALTILDITMPLFYTTQGTYALNASTAETALVTLEKAKEFRQKYCIE